MDRNEQEWMKRSPLQFPPVPNKEARISRGGTIVGIVVILILCVLLAVAPGIFGAYVFKGKEFVRTIPIFNLDKWDIICPMLLATLLLGLVDEISKLITGYYCWIVLLSSVITNAIELVLLTVLLKYIPIWNSNFAIEVSKEFDVKFTSKGDLLTYWGTETVSDVLLTVIFCIAFLDVVSTAYKTLRYGKL